MPIPNEPMQRPGGPMIPQEPLSHPGGITSVPSEPLQSPGGMHNIPQEPLQTPFSPIGPQAGPYMGPGRAAHGPQDWRRGVRF